MTVMDIAKKSEARLRIVNLRTGRVRCPYHERQVEAIENCLTSCQHFLSVDRLSRIVCGWSEEDGIAQEG